MRLLTCGNSIVETKGSRDIGKKVDALYKASFKEGMTVMEGRALQVYLETELDFSAALALMRK